MVQDCSEALVKLWQPQEYTGEDIDRLQTKTDDFLSAFVETSGASKEGLTNYIHMLCSSHLTFYMKQHRNLYKFSQQGWEGLRKECLLSSITHSVGAIMEQM